MIEIKGNIWTHHHMDPRSMICITTNGFVKPNGECVMGKGIAYQAKGIFPDLPKRLGRFIRSQGNQVYWIGEYKLFSFPTKHNWWESSDLRLIEKSTREIMDFAPSFPVFLPRPGCGNGGLKWEDVKPIVSVLPDNFFVVNNN